MNAMALARRYTGYANTYNLDGCESMFAEDMVYVSDGVGVHAGRVAIRAMMDAFFAIRPDLHWDESNYRLAGPDAVAFDFVMTGTDPVAGGPFRRVGVETIYFNPDGKIGRIEVKG